MEQPRMVSLEIVRGQSFSDTFEVLAILETEKVVRTFGYRLPNESYGKRLLGVLKQMKVEFDLTFVMEGRQIRFAAVVSKHLLEPETWGVADFEFCGDRCLSVVYDNGALNATARRKFRSKLRAFARFHQLTTAIDWRWWGGKTKFLNNLKLDLGRKLD